MNCNNQSYIRTIVSNFRQTAKCLIPLLVYFATAMLGFFPFLLADCFANDGGGWHAVGVTFMSSIAMLWGCSAYWWYTSLTRKCYGIVAKIFSIGFGSIVTICLLYTVYYENWIAIYMAALASPGILFLYKKQFWPALVCVVLLIGSLIFSLTPALVLWRYSNHNFYGCISCSIQQRNIDELTALGDRGWETLIRRIESGEQENPEYEWGFVCKYALGNLSGYCSPNKDRFRMELEALKNRADKISSLSKTRR